MRKAAGIIMLAFGIFVIVGAVRIMLRWESGGTADVWIQLAFSVLVVAAGISVLRRKAYWWALLAAIGMIVIGTTNAARMWQDVVYRHFDTATRFSMALRSWAIWGIPGILALIFLVKRKGEFETSPKA
jgi:hypothetical protein